jgi:uncharacterized protein (DUF1778 family)
MTNPKTTPAHDATAPDHNSASARASWGGSVASAGPAPNGAGRDQRPGSQVREASAEGGPKPGQGEQIPRRRNRRDSAARRARQRPRQPPASKRLHQPNARFNDEEFTLVKAAAAQCNLSVAGFLARSALSAARDLERTATEIADEREVITALFDSRRRLGWAGSNLNQAVKALNSGGPAPQLDACITAVRQAADRVHETASQLLAHRQNTP